MANCLLWEENEIPQGTYRRKLTPMLGDPSLTGLPIDLELDRIQAAMRQHRVIGVRAPTGT